MSLPERAPVKLSILFVDDDVSLLDGMRRVLRGQRDDWDMHFVAGGRKALELMDSKPFDVVVSDMRMPEMDGATLLSEVERRFPSSVRVILSGYSEEKSILRAVGPAHQYVAKPADPQIILAIMNRTLALKRVLASPALRQLVAGLRNLPSPPDLYIKLTIEMRKEGVALNTLAEMIAKDVAMTAELLKITNSAYFGIGARVTEVLQAVRLLGLDTIRLLVLSAGIFKQYEGKPHVAAMVKDMSRYSFAVAHLARRLAEMDGASRLVIDQVVCAAMLCCIGSLVLIDARSDAYLAALKRAEGAGFEDAERALFGASQAELGAYLLGIWGFGDPVTEAVLYQSRPSSCGHRQKSTLTYVHLARALGPHFPLFAAVDRSEGLLDQTYVAELGIEANVKEWKTQAPAIVMEIGQ